MRVLEYALIMLILCASCTSQQEGASLAVQAAKPAATANAPKISTPPVAAAKTADKELQKILHWFEQMDAVFREALWVIRQEKAPQGKSVFGKMQRALLIEMKQKLSNKSLFKCDVYSMTRNVPGVAGFPQDAEVMHQCNKKESFIKIGDWSHPKSNELFINFRGGNLEEVLGFATSILSPRMSCKLKSHDNDIIENFSCEGFMIDFNPAKNQVLRFNQFEYQRSAKTMLYLKAEVLENLDPVRKIEVDVPLEGKISVTETVLQAPEYLAKQVPAPTVPKSTPTPTVSPTITPDAISEEDIYHDRNGQEIDQQEDPEARGVREPKPLPAPQKSPFENGNALEGVIESSDQAPPAEATPQPIEPERPRENNTK
ncbi:MAG TPA: hypothetical protein VIG33_16180 [Pseudobdellovibrionaceae bacterium]|jgi:hypothetical protein